MATEREWVESVLRPDLYTALQAFGDADRPEWKIGVESGRKLTYAHEILAYNQQEPAERRSAAYETDLLIYDTLDSGQWIPRIVIECKKGGVTTHDALTYSTKASTHKHVHPYLRYGVLLGDFGPTIPGRLIRHGAYFDFMLAWRNEKPTESEWREMVEVLKDEITASRMLHGLLSDGRARSRKQIRSLHRPLRLKELEQ